MQTIVTPSFIGLVGEGVHREKEGALDTDACFLVFYCEFIHISLRIFR